jgi:DNA-binding FadR family transcriptional regulator
METQVLLEPIAAQLAALHPDRRAVMKPYTDPGDPATESDYRHQTTDFHEAVYKLAANPVLVLLTSAVTHTVSDHVIATMDPVSLRPSILEEHVGIAKAIAAGQAEKARRLMSAHFQAQHDYYREHWPARLVELIEWR